MMLVVIFTGHLGRVFQSWVKITQGRYNIWIQMLEIKINENSA